MHQIGIFNNFLDLKNGTRNDQKLRRQKIHNFLRLRFVKDLRPTLLPNHQLSSRNYVTGVNKNRYFTDDPNTKQ